MININNTFLRNNLLYNCLLMVSFISLLVISSTVLANSGNIKIENTQGTWLPIKAPTATGITRTLLATAKGLYAGTTAGVYFSPNNGKTWQLLTDQSTLAESLIETESKQLLIGAYRKGVLKGNSEFTNWQQVALPDANYVRDFVSIGNSIFVSSANIGGGGGVYVSKDNGASWQVTGLSEAYVLRLSSPDNKRLFASTSNGLYLSTDLGKTWVEYQQGLGQDIWVSQVIKVNKQLLAATGSSNHAGRGIFRYNPVTNKWQQYGRGLPEKVTVNKLVFKGKQLIAATNTFDNFNGVKQGLFISDDFGLTWRSANFKNKTVNDITISPTGDTFIGTEGTGIWRSKDLINWFPSNKGIRSWDIFSIYQTQQYDLLAAAQDGIWRLSTKTNQWLAPNIKLGASKVIKTNNNYLLSTADNNLLVGDEQGYNWQKVALDGQYLINLFVDDKRWYALDLRQAVKYSDDSGKNWQALPLPDKQGAHSIIKANNGDLLAANRYNGLYRSTDNGKTWQYADRDLNIWTLAKNDKGELFASVIDRGMYRSKDNGKSWQEINNGLGTKPIRSAWSILTDKNTIYIAAYNRGFFKSTDNGNTWQAMSQGLNKPMALSLFLSESGEVFGGTSAGIYQWQAK